MDNKMIASKQGHLYIVFILQKTSAALNYGLSNTQLQVSVTQSLLAIHYL